MTCGNSHWKLVIGVYTLTFVAGMAYEAASSSILLDGGTSLYRPRWITLPIASLPVKPFLGLALPFPFFLKHIGLAIGLHYLVSWSLYLKAEVEVRLC